jgi:hypothetical protein
MWKRKVRHMALLRAPCLTAPSDYIFHAYSRSEGVCGIIITDFEYPKLVAHQLLSKVLDEFVSKYPKSAYASATKDSPQMSFPELKDYVQKYQDPQQADSIMKIQKELDETKIVLHKTIESVLERGEKIDTLVQKSDGLSAQSKMFYTQVCREYVKVTRLDANTLSRPKSRTRAASSCKCWSRFAGFLILLGRSQRDFIVETSNPAYRLHSIRTIHSVF